MEEQVNTELLPLHAKELTDKEFEPYVDEFKTVFSDDLCRNIALSGPYGAGKTSVIKKAREKYRDLTWIFVSLAAFEGCGANKNPNSANGDSVDDDVEAEVLRQIIHKVDLSKAPKSRLRKTQDYGWARDCGIAIYLFALLLFCWGISIPASKVAAGEALSSPDLVIMIAWSGLVLTGLTFLLRRNLFSKLLKSFKFMDAELHIEGEDERSPYERCVDEMAYVLNSTSVDVIVFEDLDRFDSLSIFQKMRNLNILVNDSRGKDGKEPLRFFYLMRDGLFKEPRDRTKFFDFVIPVVPYVDPSNVQDRFDEALRKVGVEVNDGFLYQLSSYIDDPRIIHDIADETAHYKSVLFGERTFVDGDAERLVAILSYKAMFPEDFEHLLVGRGYLHEVLNGKRRLIANLKDWNDDEIVRLESEIKEIDSKLSCNENELTLLYAIPRLSNVSRYIGNFTSIGSPEEVMQAIEANSSAYQILEEIKERLSGDEEYSDRLAEIRKSAKSKKSLARARIKWISARKENIDAMSIKQLIEEAPSADDLFIFDSEQIARSEDFEELGMDRIMRNPSFNMIRFLVSSGWIDESYRRYTSNFYSGALCARDYDFLSCVQQAKKVDMEYEPFSPKEIIRRMDAGVFARVGIRNPWLIAELLKDGPENKLRAFMGSVVRSGKLPYLVEFTCSDQFTPEVFEQAFDYFDDPMVDVLESDVIDDKSKRSFARRYIAFGGEMLREEKPDGGFAKSVSNMELLLETDSSVSKEAFKSGLRQLGFIACSLNQAKCDPELVRFILDEKMFSADVQVVQELMTFSYGKSNLMKSGMLISEVLALGKGPIAEVVLGHPDVFIGTMVDKCSCAIHDDASAIKIVLNLKGLSEEVGLSYIGKLEKDKVSDVTNIQSMRYRTELFVQGVASPTSRNVATCFTDGGGVVSDTLCDFLKDYGVPNDFTKEKASELGVDAAVFAEGMIMSDSCDADLLYSVLSKLGIVFKSFNVVAVDDLKLSSMIRSCSIDMNADILVEIRKCEPGRSSEYALCDMDAYIDLVVPKDEKSAPCNYEERELIDILSSKVDCDSKLKVLSGFDGAVKLEDEYPIPVKMQIISSHLFQDDIANLPNLYESISDKDFRKLIESTLAVNVATVEKESIRFGWSLAGRVVSKIEGGQIEKKRFALWYVGEYATKGDRAKIRGLFESAGLSEYVKLLDGPSSMIDKTAFDDDLLGVLSDLDMCGAIGNGANANGQRKVSSRGFKRKPSMSNR